MSREDLSSPPPLRRHEPSPGRVENNELTPKKVDPPKGPLFDCFSGTLLAPSETLFSQPPIDMNAQVDRQSQSRAARGLLLRASLFEPYPIFGSVAHANEHQLVEPPLTKPWWRDDGL